ncbi:NAD-dependent epimerase/dehydratase family protein [Kitasatospora sp. NPDC088391]|uniref:NAD-dependent epimerase/dehydratase family protein n=1 Tax=Kitasatospora sp. NPDC088391 TaxID=3364074 RepID=UPI0038117D4F
MSQFDTRAAEPPRPVAGRSVLVLGSTGFVGRHVCEALARAGARVTGVARSSPARPAAERQVALDLTTAGPDRLAALLADTGAEVVVNAAGAVWGVAEEQMLRANAELPEHLVAAVAATAASPRVVHLGSVHEYGRGPRGVAITEDLATAPVTAYGRSKLRGARAVLAAAREGTADAVVLRIANVSGPGTPRGSLLGTIAAHLADLSRPGTAAPPPLRLTPLRAQRDFVDVRDVAAAVLAAAERGPSGTVVNLGRGEAVAVRGLVDRLIELSGLPAEVVEENDGAEQRGGDVEWQQVDITRAARVLGWTPVRSLDTSLRDLLAETLHPAPAA